jgi:hypothetical protein
MVQLRNLDYFRFNLIDFITLLFTGRHHFYKIPRPVRFAVVHAGITFATATTFPPAIDLPAIIVPILWAGSFALTYSVMALIRI